VTYSKHKVTGSFKQTNHGFCTKNVISEHSYNVHATF